MWHNVYQNQLKLLLLLAGQSDMRHLSSTLPFSEPAIHEAQ
jgi:hypothetical protein